MDNFSNPLATINLPKSPIFLVKFCKGVNIYHFSSKIIFGNFYRHLAIFFGHTGWDWTNSSRCYATPFWAKLDFDLKSWKGSYWCLHLGKKFYKNTLKQLNIGTYIPIEVGFSCWVIFEENVDLVSYLHWKSVTTLMWYFV